MSEFVREDWVETIRKELAAARPEWESGGIDTELAVLLVARKLELSGREMEAAELRLDLGEKMIRAALHEAEHPGPLALGVEMAKALRLNPGVVHGVVSKSAKKGGT